MNRMKLKKPSAHITLRGCLLWMAVIAVHVPTQVVAQSPSQVQASGATGKNLDRVTVGNPLRKSLKLFTTQPAKIQPFERAPLTSKLSGYVAEVLVEIGDSVTVGQPLLRLNMPELQDEVHQMEAMVAHAAAEVAQSESQVLAAKAMAESKKVSIAVTEAALGRNEADYQRWAAEASRIKELAGRGSVTPKLFEETNSHMLSTDAGRREATAMVLSAKATANEAAALVGKAEADLVAAKAKQRIAEADLAKAKTMLGYADLRAPFKGVITQRAVDVGQFVTSAAEKPLLVVERTYKVRVVIDVPELEAAWVTAGENGDPVNLKVQSLGGREFTGVVSRTGWALDESNHALRTETDILNADAALRSGMFATASILLEQRSAVLTLPLAAIVKDGATSYCCVVVGGKIERKALELGLRSGDEVEVVRGLSENDKVVLTRAAGLLAGQEVNVIESAK
ncbi:MAG: efflux RND transporter periplasmic adaptor subunit [Pirellulaceae bacterium]|nr:efflux RND transporter periplasmic adaptor subunit [Pirellulaceae bacterium]